QVTIEDVGQCFQPEVAARLRAFRRVGPVLVPELLVLAGLGEGPDQHRLDAEARVREPAVGALDVLAEGEFDAARAVADDQLAAGLAVLELDDRVLPADAVGTAVEEPAGGDAAGEGAVDLHVLALDHVADADL